VLDDPGIIEQIRKLRRSGTVVKIVTALLNFKKNPPKVVTRGWDNSIDVQRHQQAIRDLAKMGVLLRSPPTTPHIKLALRVGGPVMFGSANFTTNSIRGKAIELAMRREEAVWSNALGTAFQQVWESCIWSLGSSNRALMLQQRIGTPIKMETAAHHYPAVCLSQPGSPAAIAETLTSIINRAGKEVILTGLSFYDTSLLPGFWAAMKGALDRNVRLRVAVRPEHFKIEKFPDESTRELLDSGLELVGVSDLHAKGVLVDNQICGLLSANFNPYSLDPTIETSNLEMGVFERVEDAGWLAAANFLRSLVEVPTHRLTRTRGGEK